MQVHYHLSSFTKLQQAVATIGTFDGVHKGHQKILSTLTRLAKDSNAASVVVTFWPHPRKVLQPNAAEHKILFTLQERIALLSAHDIDHLVVIPFDLDFAKITPEVFISDVILGQIGATTLILGYDHRFGNNREGSFEYLKANSNRYGLNLIEIPRQDIDEIGISSSRIRQAIGAADFTASNKLLGHSFYLTGKVVAGQMLGRKIGFPTANLEIEGDKILPADGVYAVWVVHENQQYLGMMNIGYRPTVSGSVRTIEVHILNFNTIIYGAYLKIIFEKKLRNEQKFDGLDALIAQLNQDKIATESLLSNLQNI